MSDAEVIHFPGRPRRVVQLRGAEFSEVLDDVESVVSDLDEPVLFQRQGGIVEVALIDSEGTGIHRRLDGTPAIVEVSAERLRDIISRIIECQRFDAKEKSYVPCAPPLDYMKSLLSRTENRLPILRAITLAPTLSPDGRIIQTPGYDRASGTFGVYGGEWPTVPRSPSREDALEALGALLDVIREFPFQNDAARAVWVAAVLTGVIRHALRAAPFFAISAPTSGTGKTLSAILIGLIVTGLEPLGAAVSLKPEEFRKVLFSVLQAAATVINFDNVERPISDEALCSILTQPLYTDRAFMTQTVKTLPTRKLFLTTGNNVAVRGDLRTRTLVAHLDAQLEHPEGRIFERENLRDFVLTNRARLVIAALTILRAHHVAGRPDMGATPYGRFEEWSSWVRASLLWLDFADPCDTRSLVEQRDDEGEKFAMLVTAWAAAYGDQAVTLSQLREDCNSNQSSEAFAVLREATLAVARDKRGSGIDSSALGYYLRGKKDRIAEGLRVADTGNKRHQAVLWKAESVVGGWGDRDDAHSA